MHAHFFFGEFRETYKQLANSILATKGVRLYEMSKMPERGVPTL